MSVYCGVDIIEIERLRRSIEETGGFKERVFTGREIEYCDKRNKARYESYAARFAGKEAVLKALGTGLAEGLEWKMIEILNDEKGKPHVTLSQKALELYEGMGAGDMDISLSHCGSYAVAYVVIQA